MLCALEGDRIRYLSHGLADSGGLEQRPRGGSGGRGRVDARRGRPTRSAARAFRPSAVTLGIGGRHIHGAQSRGMYEFGRPRELTAEDLSYAAELRLRRAA